MYKLLKNVFLNSFVITKTSGIIPTPQGPSSLLTHHSLDIDHTLQYRTTNLRHIPSKDDYKRTKPPIKIFPYNPDCERYKKHASVYPYITTEKMYLERNLQKQFILPNCFTPSLKKEKEKENISTDRLRKSVSSNDRLSYCLKSSITSPKQTRTIPTLNLWCYPTPQPEPKYPLYSSSLDSSGDELSPRKALSDFPEEIPSRQAFDMTVDPPRPPSSEPFLPSAPCPTICPQPCDSHKNVRLMKLPLCPLPCPPESPRSCLPLSNCSTRCRPCGSTSPFYSPIFSTGQPHSGSRQKPHPCEF